MFDHPQNYFNGTAPLNVTGVINSCVAQPGGALTCTVVEGTDRDSYLWYVLVKTTVENQYPYQKSAGMMSFTPRSKQIDSWLGRSLVQSSADPVVGQHGLVRQKKTIAQYVSQPIPLNMYVYGIGLLTRGRNNDRLRACQQIEY